MKRKLKLRSILAVLLAFVITFAGIDPMGLLSGIMKEVQAEDLTTISWDDFSNVTYGKDYARDESLTYSSASLNQTAFEDYVQFTDGGALLYGAAGTSNGIRMGVTDGVFWVQGNGYWKDGANAAINKQTCTAANLGLSGDTLAGVKLKLRVVFHEVSENNDWVIVTVEVNDYRLWNAVKMVNGGESTLLGNIIRIKGSYVTIPEKPLTEINWDDFSDVTYGIPYESATQLAYSDSSVTSLNNTAFEDYVQFAAGGYLLYGSSGVNHGIKIGVNTDGEFHVVGASYRDSSESNASVVQATRDAAALGVSESTLADVKLKLRVELTNVSEALDSAIVTIEVNGITVWEDVALYKQTDASSEVELLGNEICLYQSQSSGTVTIPLTEINWDNFSGVEYGETYTSATKLTYSGTSLNGTAFEDYVQFAEDGYLQYAASCETAQGVMIGVDENGAVYVKGVNYWKDGSSTDAGYKQACTAADLKLTDETTLVGVKLRLRVEFHNVNAENTSVTVTVEVNGHRLWDAITVKRSADTVALLGNIIYMRSAVTIPEKPLKEISWDDFSDVTYGIPYESATQLAYSDSSVTSLNNMAFEDYVQFAAGGYLLYGSSGVNHGIKIGVNTNGVFHVVGASYRDSSESNASVVQATRDAAALGVSGSTLADVKLKLRVELTNVSDALDSAIVTIKVNGITVWEDVALYRQTDASSEVELLGNEICLYQSQSSGTVTIPLTEINWDNFSGVEYGKTYTTSTKLAYNDSTVTSLNNTAFEDYVRFEKNGYLLYSSSGTSHGIKMGLNANGDFYIVGASYRYNGNIKGDDYSATELGVEGTLVGAKLKLRVELRDVSDDLTSATVTVKVNDIPLWDSITLTKLANTDTVTYNPLGNEICLCSYDSKGIGPVTIPAKSLTKIGWSDFAEDGTALADGETISSERLVTYTGTDLSNTAFEGDVSLPAGSGFRYASADGSYGLEIKESEGTLLIGGTEGVQLGGSNTTVYTCTPEEYSVGTSFADKRFTIRIEFVYLITDSEANSSSARVNISINGIEVAKEVILESEAGNADYMLSPNIGLGMSDLATGIAVYDVAPTLEEITSGLEVLSWEEFGYTGGVTTSEPVTRTASHLDTLQGYLFNGDIIIQKNTYIYYAYVSGTYVRVRVRSGGGLEVILKGNNETLQTYNAIANHHNLSSFADTPFNLKIVYTSDGEISVWVNDAIVGNPFKTDLVFGTAITAGANVTPISLRTTAPTDLTKISFDDWTKDDASDVSLDGKLLNSELRGAHLERTNLFDTSLHEVVKFVDTNDTVGCHTFVYGGCTGEENTHKGIRIGINEAGEMTISCVNEKDTTVAKFTIDPVTAGVGTTFRGEEFSWKLDTKKLENHVLLYMSFNGNLYNNAPFVFPDFAASMVANMYYTSYELLNGEDTEKVNNCYVILGASIKELPVLYHDLTDNDYYTIPAYEKVTFYEKDVNGEWVEATTPDTLTTTGDYKLAFNDGVSDYTQIISCYKYEDDMDSATLVRSLKMANNTEDDWEHYETRLCDKNYDGKVASDDISVIRSMLLGTYVADADVMKISGFFSPTASLIEDETYATIKATGVNHIIESNMYYTDDALARYRIYQELSYAQKYGLTVTVNDKRLTDMGANSAEATAEDVEDKVANYKEYQSFAGLFIVDEPKAEDYPRGEYWLGHDEVGTYSSVAKAIAEAGYEGWSNAFSGNTDIFYDNYNNSHENWMRYGYYNYLINMVESYDLNFMSATHYPFLKNTSSYDDTMWCYFMNLAMTKDVATQKDIELRTFVQGMAADSDDMNANYSKAQLKWNANMNLTFGTRALEYFPLVQPGNFLNYEDGTCASGLLDKNGKLTPFGEWATSVNEQVQAIDHILLNATHEGFMAIGGNTAYATTVARENVESITMTGDSTSKTISHTFIEEADGYEGVKVTSTDSTYGAFAGCFDITGGTYAGKHAMYIVNYNDASANTITVDLGDVATATAIYQGTETPHSGNFNITLEAGEAVLVVY